MLRSMGIPVIVTAHNGVLPLKDVDGSFLEENGIEGDPTMLKIGLRTLMRSIVVLSTFVIVHEEGLEQLLLEDYAFPKEKMKVIHHGVESTGARVSNAEGKKRIGMEGHKIILFLGYITGYKNLELLIDSSRYLRTEGWTIVIAGGQHPRLKGTPEYEEYIVALKDRAAEISKDNIIFKGFIDPKDLPDYLAASDLLVLPYKICMSASGPLSIAIANNIPVLVSTAFRGVIDIESITFQNDPQALAAKMDDVLSNGMPSEADLYISEFREARQWRTISMQTYDLYKLAARRV